MEYVQMTLMDWMEIKQRLKLELQGIKQSFVRIGFVLRKIDEERLYENDGYKSVAEFAKAEYGLEASTVSRFMSINREYSIDGYSEHLREEYLDMSRSQLEEMLKLPESDRVMIQPETARADIRELKKFNNSAPVAGTVDTVEELIEMFFKEHREILNELCFLELNSKQAAELINPSGNKSYKKGMFFMMMYENKIVIKKFGGVPKEISWEEFLNITYNIFENYGKRTWEMHFGEPEPVAEEPAETIMESTGNIEENVGKTGIAPAQKKEEKQGISGVSEYEKEEKRVSIIDTVPMPLGIQDYQEEQIGDEQLPGQMEIADYPELLPEGEKDGIHRTTDDDGRTSNSGNIECDEGERGASAEPGTPSNEPEAAQSDAEGSEEKGEENQRVTRSIKDIGEEIVSENETIRRMFAVFSRGKMPLGELELAKEHVQKMLANIEEVIRIKKGE